MRFSNYEYESEIHNSLLRLQSYSGTVDSSSQLKFFHAPNGVVAAIRPRPPPWVKFSNDCKFFHAPNGVVAAIRHRRPPWVMILNYL